MLRRALLVFAVSALATAGCGSSSRLSKEAYATKANAICTDFNAKVKASGTPGTSLDSLTRYIDRVLPLFEDGLGKLKKLKPPEDEQMLAHRWLETGDQQLAIVKKLRDAASRGNRAEVQRFGAQSDANNKRSHALARQLGANTCAEG